MKTNKTTEAKLEMKQVFRKDPPIVFDPDTVIRHCNASQRTPYTGPRWNVREGADAHLAAESTGTPC